MNINQNFMKGQDSYFFATISEKIEEAQEKNPNRKIIKMSIGSPRGPIPKVSADAMKKAIDELLTVEKFRGYGPEIGYDFLRKKVAEVAYNKRGVDISFDEITISQGINEDISKFQLMLDMQSKISVTDPVYPVYVDTNVMAGRSGNYDEGKGLFEGINYSTLSDETNFKAPLPDGRVGIIYLCSPNNPTGIAMTKKELKEWVDYAKANNAIILFDGAYERFVTNEDVPHSIYEVEGAKDVAVEFRSFSKDASFAGVRCAYTVVPKELMVVDEDGNNVQLLKIWKKFHATTQNGCSYIIQRGAEAVLTPEGQKEIDEKMAYYRENCKIILDALHEKGIKTQGGIDGPYIWFKVPEGYDSWSYFDYLLNEKGVATTPGVGFGPAGEGYVRVTAFASKEETKEAMKRILE